MCRGQIIVGSNESHMGDAEPSQKVFSICPLSVVLCESLNSIRTYVRYVCECDHRLRLRPLSAFPSGGYPAFGHGISSNQRVVKKLCPSPIGCLMTGPALRLRR